MNVNSTVDKEVPQVVFAIERINKQITSINEWTNKLNERLIPITGILAFNELKISRGDNLVPLAEDLSNIYDRLCEIENRIDILLNGLQI